MRFTIGDKVHFSDAVFNDTVEFDAEIYKWEYVTTAISPGASDQYMILPLSTDGGPTFPVIALESQLTLIERGTVGVRLFMTCPNSCDNGCSTCFMPELPQWLKDAFLIS